MKSDKTRRYTLGFANMLTKISQIEIHLFNR